METMRARKEQAYLEILKQGRARTTDHATQKERACAAMRKLARAHTPDGILPLGVSIDDNDPMWWYFAALAVQPPAPEVIERMALMMEGERP